MKSQDIPWTESEEIESYQAGNTMLDFVGYIESVGSLTSVETYQKFIYKIILNNSKGTKVRAVFWKDKAVEWSSKLTLYQIVEITGCTVADVKFQYNIDLKNVIAPQELHLQDFSTVNILGKFNAATAVAQEELQYQETTIEKCLEHGKALIAVGGYVRNDFHIFKTIGTVASANGNIGDGHYRLCVQINGYSETLNLKKGVYATFRGKIETSKPGSFLLSVEDMSKVVVDESKPKMSLENLRKSFHQPITPKPNSTSSKRPADGEKENRDGNVDSEKKVKND